MTPGRSHDAPAALSRATALRLSHYLRFLPAGPTTVSSSLLATAVGVSDAQVRRDLAALGHLGQRGVGYDAVALTEAIRRTLGIHHTWRAVLIGVGNLAKALLNYRGFRQRGFLVVGLFDCDPAVIGTDIDGLPVTAADRLFDSVKLLAADLGVLTVPADAAQGIADTLCRAGIKGILNFAPTRLKIPNPVREVTVDLSIQFEQLAFLVSSDGAAGHSEADAEDGLEAGAPLS